VRTSILRYLVTGAAGFIGYHVASRLLAEGAQVVGLDSVNDYYDKSLKESRLRELGRAPGFTFIREDLCSSPALLDAVARCSDGVIHLAAQAGVRYSLSAPHEYVQSNVLAFLNVLEAVRAAPPRHFVYASSSSVYGASTKSLLAVGDSVMSPVSLYAATKASNELMAATYSHLFGIPMTGLRFFTVYGPWGRPDMAYFKFVASILRDEPIDVYNGGNLSRDFTYVDDVVEAVRRILDLPPSPTIASGTASSAPHRVLNVGLGSPVRLTDFIGKLEVLLGRVSRRNLVEMQQGDVVSTWADVEPLSALTGFRPKVNLFDGLGRFVEWYRSYYKT
jgi:UDP-glucuronate 4-epimerase